MGLKLRSSCHARTLLNESHSKSPGFFFFFPSTVSECHEGCNPYNPHPRKDGQDSEPAVSHSCPSAVVRKLCRGPWGGFIEQIHASESLIFKPPSPGHQKWTPKSLFSVKISRGPAPLLRIASMLCSQPLSTPRCPFNVWQSMNCKHVLRHEGGLETGAGELALKKRGVGLNMSY